MAAGLLEVHWMMQHGKAKEDKWSWTDAATGGGGEPQTYRIEFPTKGGGNRMPSGGLPGKDRDTDDDEGAFLAPACRIVSTLDVGGFPPPR